MRWLLSVLFVCAACAPAWAQFKAPAKLDLSGDGDVVTLSGEIGRGTGQAFMELTRQAPQLRMLRLESPGGIVEEARIVARAVQLLRLDTYVEHGCASACTLIFYAGANRWLRPEARLGFHGYAVAKGMTASAAQIDAAEDVERDSYRASGLPRWFIEKIFATPNSSIWFPSTQELLASKFATDVTVDDYPVDDPPRDGLPAVNHPVATAGAALPHVIGP